MGSLLLRGQKRLHWRDEDAVRRDKIVATVASVDMAAVVVLALRGKRLISRELRVEVARPLEERMLWVPDVLAGSVGAARDGNPRWLDAIRKVVTEIDIALR